MLMRGKHQLENPGRLPKSKSVSQISVPILLCESSHLILVRDVTSLTFAGFVDGTHFPYLGVIIILAAVKGWSCAIYFNPGSIQLPKLRRRASSSPGYGSSKGTSDPVRWWLSSWSPRHTSATEKGHNSKEHTNAGCLKIGQPPKLQRFQIGAPFMMSKATTRRNTGPCCLDQT